MRFHVIQDLTGKIKVSTKVWKSDKVLYTAPTAEKAGVYCAYLQGSRCYTGQQGMRAVDRLGREITIPTSAQG